MTGTPTSAAAAPTQKTNQRRVAFAAVIGTTIEWYDYFTYSTAAALVFAHLYFAPAGEGIGQMLAFATIGISFLFRPLGAFLSGHFGDRLGRRAILVVTLVTMGVATALIGLIPTYETIGVTAPILLILLRIIQGLSAGGEWGGAALLAVEHADVGKRGRAGSYPQLGVPLGMLLSSGVIALMTGVISPGEAFMEWGWRIPFLLSVVLIGVGYWVRRAVEDTPVFQEMNAETAKRKAPILVLFKKHLPLVLVAALIFAGNNASGYMTTGGFVTKYATDPVGFDQTDVLLAITFGSFVWLVSTAASGVLADRIGRVKTSRHRIHHPASSRPSRCSGSSTPATSACCTSALGIFSIGWDSRTGRRPPCTSNSSLPSIRFSGVGHLLTLWAAVLGGAFAPTIAQDCCRRLGPPPRCRCTCWSWRQSRLLAVSLVRDRKGIDLSVANEDEQSAGMWRASKR